MPTMAGPPVMDVGGDADPWNDLWFYTNPIFIRVADQPKLLVETNRELAKTLASNP